MDVYQKDKLLKLLPSLTPDFDAMDCTRTYRATYGERIDWHPVASYLDEMEAKKLLRISPGRRYDGFVRYMLNA